MKNLIFTIESESGAIKPSREIVAVAGENMQGYFIVEFDKVFIDGTATLEFRKDNKKGFINLEKRQNETYTGAILQSVVEESGDIDFQVKIVQSATGESIPIYKSHIVRLRIAESINADMEITE